MAPGLTRGLEGIRRRDRGSTHAHVLDLVVVRDGHGGRRRRHAHCESDRKRQRSGNRRGLCGRLPHYAHSASIISAALSVSHDEQRIRNMCSVSSRVLSRPAHCSLRRLCKLLYVSPNFVRRPILILSPPPARRCPRVFGACGGDDLDDTTSVDDDADLDPERQPLVTKSEAAATTTQPTRHPDASTSLGPPPPYTSN